MPITTNVISIHASRGMKVVTLFCDSVFLLVSAINKFDQLKWLTIALNTYNPNVLNQENLMGGGVRVRVFNATTFNNS